MFKSLKMSRITTLLLLVCLNVGLSCGIQCSLGHKNFVSRIIDSCPGLLDSEDKSYCCLDIENSKMYCCNSMEFVVNSSWMLLTVIVAVIVVFALVAFCVSCLCCRCCPWYRRRHQGTVYGKVQVPSVVHVIQPAASVPQPTQQYANPACPTNSTGMPQPPAYADVMYEKQAPYNPSYVSAVRQ